MPLNAKCGILRKVARQPPHFHVSEDVQIKPTLTVKEKRKKSSNKYASSFYTVSLFVSELERILVSKTPYLQLWIFRKLDNADGGAFQIAFSHHQPRSHR
jgi:hypothetical protein